MRLIILLAFVFSGAANAATIIYSDPGVATAISNLEINGNFYNVDFNYDIASGMWTTYGGTEQYGEAVYFWSTVPETWTAANAINEVLNAAGVFSLNNPSTTVYEVLEGLSGIGAAGIVANPTIGWDTSYGYGVTGSYTAWTQVVPIPGAIWLMASGLGLLGFAKRK